MRHLAQKSPRKSKSLISQFLLFTGVGAIGTTGHYVTLVTLVQAGQIAPVYASACGFVIGALINYYLNYRYTFASTKNHTETLAKFMLVAVLGFVINGGIMALGTEWAHFNYILVQLVATGTVLLFGFSFNKWWTFAVAGPHQTKNHKGPAQ